MSRSLAWRHLAQLEVGDAVPLDCYVLDYKDGGRPCWTVLEAEERGSGVRRLVLADRANGADDPGHEVGAPVAAVTVLTCERFTRRTQPYVLVGDLLVGGGPSVMCDMDQQARAITT